MDSLTPQLPSTLLARTRRGRPPRPPELRPNSRNPIRGQEDELSRHHMSLIDGLAHFEVMAGKSPRFGRRQTARLELRNQLLLARQHPSAKRIHVEPSRA